ncbi:MAG: transporter substrate-binding domain-containing protein [Eubacteriales bacterium]|nr:transporter substrate-binding domain-containing protein [Eubacteriales bacterium]
MKKRVIAVMMAAMMAAGTVSAVNVYAEEEERSTFTVGFDAEYPPFGYMDDDGEYVGFDLDVAQLVCDNLGWELVKKPINWDSKDMELNSGNIDCIWNGFTINGREDDYTWSDPYLNNEQVMVVAADSGIEKLADLAGKNVVVQAASAALDALNSDDNKELTESFGSLTENPDYNTAFMNIDSGAADAVAVDIGVAKYQLAQREEGKYVILEEPIQSEQYGIGFALGNDELKDTVWAEVMKLYEEGKVTELAEKYEVADMLCLGEEDAEAEDAGTEEADAEAEDTAEEADADAESAEDAGADEAEETEAE